MSQTLQAQQKQMSIYLTVVLIFAGCADAKKKDDTSGSPAQQISNSSADTLPQITSDNSTKCGDLLASRSSAIDIKICEARTQINSLGVDTFLTSSGAATLGAKGISISLVSWDGLPALKEGEVYKLMSQRDPHDGRIMVPDSVKSWAAAAYGDGPMTNRLLQGSLSYTKVPRKTGDLFEVTFNFLSADGKVNVAGKANGVATDSTLMKPDKN